MNPGIRVLILASIIIRMSSLLATARAQMSITENNRDSSSRSARPAQNALIGLRNCWLTSRSRL